MISKKNDLSFDPIDFYKGPLFAEFVSQVDKFLLNLEKTAKIDEEGNKKLVKNINHKKEKLNSTKGSLTLFNFLRILMIILIVGGVISLILGFVLELEILYRLICIGVGVVLIIFGGIMIAKVINTKIKELKDEILKNQNAVNSLIRKGILSLNPYRNLLTFKDFINLVNSTTDLIHLDNELSPRKLLMIHQAYGYDFSYNDSQSVAAVVSGDIVTNPFIKVKIFGNEIRDHVYHGSRVVTWTETYHDSQGRTRYRTVSETLTASVTAPAPEYYYDSAIIYGNEAAPKLSFSRSPCGLKKDHDEKDIDKIVKKRSKDIDDYGEKAILKGKKFTPLADMEFESLFGAIDRDNEVEFRLLFTPLAMQNMKEIITSDVGYGDDFYFSKRKKLNIVSSIHGTEDFDYIPYQFDDYYDYSLLKNNLRQHLINLFNSLYFDLAPILAIPLYQMTDAGIYDPAEILEHVSPLEAESLVNEMNRISNHLFTPDEGDEPNILKVKYRSSMGNTDIYDVDAHSFTKIEHIESVPVMARNGRIYNVNVTWYEFIPVYKKSSIGVRQFDLIDNIKLTKEGDLDILQSSVRNKNFVGFYLEEGYNYTKDDDKYFVEFINSRYVKKHN